MRFQEFKSVLVESVQLNEGARIDHAEDLIFTEGSRGPMRFLEAIKSLEKGGHKDVTVKWDGSPAIIFGRNSDGNFILTDKSGFTAKGYDGRAKSSEELEQMLMNRPGAKNPDPKKREKYQSFVGNMTDIFDEYEKAVPKDFQGYFKGDLLYYNTPEKVDGKYIFTPNVVTYKVDANSDLGKKISASKTGVVIHRQIDAEGREGPIQDKDIFRGNEVLVVPPVTVERPVEIDDTKIKELETSIKQNAAGIDELLNKTELAQMQLTDFANILYTYTNQSVDRGTLDKLGADFASWLASSKVSSRKQAKILEYIKKHATAWQALWNTVRGVQLLKNEIIRQLDSQEGQAVEQEIGSHGPAKPETHGKGGEGYVLAHPEGDIKLVPREFFTKANRSVER